MSPATATRIATLQAAAVRVQHAIDNHFRPEAMTPTKAQMKRYNDALNAMTTERRAIRAQIANLQVAGERVFANDAAALESWERFEAAKQRQLAGVLRSCGRR